MRSGLLDTDAGMPVEASGLTVDGRTDLTTHTQASDEAGPASGYTPELLNSKAGEMLSTKGLPRLLF